jgi:hypothetical protein
MTATAGLRVKELRRRLHGGLYEPGDEEYVDACTLFNSMSQRRPRFVALHDARRRDRGACVRPGTSS